MARRFQLSVMALGLLGLIAGSARAGLIVGSSTGVFGNAAGSSVSGLNTNSITMGDGFLGRSALTYSGQSFDVDVLEEFQFGSLTFANHWDGAGTVPATIDLVLSFDFTAPVMLTDGQVSSTLTIIQTVNLWFGDILPDGVVLGPFDSTPSAPLFSYDGSEYSFEFTRVGGVSGSAFTESLPGNAFGVFEFTTGTAGLLGRFDKTTVTAAAAVPEPSTMAAGLLGVALAGAGAWRNRRRTGATVE